MKNSKSKLPLILKKSKFLKFKKFLTKQTIKINTLFNTQCMKLLKYHYFYSLLLSNFFLNFYSILKFLYSHKSKYSNKQKLYKIFTNFIKIL